MEKRLIPRRDAVAQVEGAACPLPSNDQIDRWESAGLLCQPPSLGRPSTYGYTATQVARLVEIARLAAGLESKRPRNAEIAFWLCFAGATDVPPELVCEHIEAVTRTFQSALRRLLNELGTRSEGRHIGIIGMAKKLGGLLARQITLKVIPGLARSSLAREVIGVAIAVVLHTSTKPEAYGNVVRDMRQATTVLRRDSTTPPEGALRELFAMIADFAQFLRLDKGNPALIAVQDIVRSGNPAAIFQVTDFGARFLAAAGSVFPWMIDASSARFLPPKDQKTVNRYFAPIICGVLATVRQNEYTQSLASQLRAGDASRVVNDFKQMKQMGNEIFNTISFKEDEHEQP